MIFSIAKFILGLFVPTFPAQPGEVGILGRDKNIFTVPSNVSFCSFLLVLVTWLIFANPALAQNYFSRAYDLNYCSDKSFSVEVINGNIQLVSLQSSCSSPSSQFFTGGLLQVDYETGDSLFSWIREDIFPNVIFSTYVTEDNTFIAGSVNTPFNGIHKLDREGEVVENGFFPFQDTAIFSFFLEGNDSLLMVGNIIGYEQDSFNIILLDHDLNVLRDQRMDFSSDLRHAARPGYINSEGNPVVAICYYANGFLDTTCDSIAFYEILPNNSKRILHEELPYDFSPFLGVVSTPQPEEGFYYYSVKDTLVWDQQFSLRVV